MALINRLSRLFRADIHAVLDRIEEPDVLLRQAVREMEEELVRDEQRIRILDHEQGQLIARESDVEHSLKEIAEELDICFSSAKEDLARGLIKRKLEAQRFLAFLCRKRESQQETLAGLRAQLEENRARLDSMRQKAELLAGEESTEQAGDNWMTPDFTVRDEDVEIAFLREKQQRSRL